MAIVIIISIRIAHVTPRGVVSNVINFLLVTDLTSMKLVISNLYC